MVTAGATNVADTVAALKSPASCLRRELFQFARRSSDFGCMLVELAVGNPDSQTTPCPQYHGVTYFPRPMNDFTLLPPQTVLSHMTGPPARFPIRHSRGVDLRLHMMIFGLQSASTPQPKYTRSYEFHRPSFRCTTQPRVIKSILSSPCFYANRHAFQFGYFRHVFYHAHELVLGAVLCASSSLQPCQAIDSDPRQGHSTLPSS